MAVLVSNCGGDENGNLWGGTAGDQTGREYKVAEWSNWGQVAVYRHPNAKVRAAIAKKARAAAENNLIGYDQSQRMTFFNQLKKAKWDPSKITVACESDCSGSTGAIIHAVGEELGDEKLKAYDYSLSTHSMNSALIAAGFKKLTASKYLNGSSYLLAGDIQLQPAYHVNVVITSGGNASSEAETTSMPTFIAATFRFTAASECNVRNAPTTADSKNITGTFDPGDSVTCDGWTVDNGNIWATYLNYNGARRYVSMGNAHSWMVIS